jgi:anti-anti-sigma factor
MEEIKISVSRRGYGQDVYVVRVDGFIDTLTAPELERTLGTMVDQGKYNLVMDLAGVDYISSAGWGIFISRIKEIRKHGGDLKLVRMSPGVYEVFELLEFDRILRAYDKVEEAEKDFGAVPEGVSVSSPQRSFPQDSSKKKEKPAEGSRWEEYEAPSDSQEVKARPELSVEEKIKEIVKGEPLWGSRQIRRELNSAKYGWVKLGWWRAWRILRKLGFNSKRKRMDYAKQS